MTTMEFQTIVYETDGPIATITLNRPDQANAQSMQMIDEIDAAFDLAGADDAIRVVVLAANGKHFSSGHDLKELVGPHASEELRARRATPERRFRHERQMYFERCVRIYEFPKPTIAAVHGKCVAAGLMLAAMCDIIIAAEDAEFSNPVARMSGAGVELLIEPWELGIRKAKEFLLTGEPIDAREAWRLGMVNKVVARDALLAAAYDMATKIARVPPVTAERIKDSINQTFEFMGKRHSWNFHFMVHHFTHNTATALRLLAEREQMGSMREVFEARDRGDVPGQGHESGEHANGERRATVEGEG
ncbi:MAG: enoyl-CoA hydratase [Acidimicrobiales bacterium]|nr:enoyl-CoA hydratase [Acidimicrobiales bacterium]